MEFRTFGKTGIQISAIGIGCWEIGGGYGSIEETEFIKAVNRALDRLEKEFVTTSAPEPGRARLPAWLAEIREPDREGPPQSDQTSCRIDGQPFRSGAATNQASW